MSLKLMKSSLNVLKLDKELIFYPLFSVVTLFASWSAFIYISYVTGFIEYLFYSASDDTMSHDFVFLSTILISCLVTNLLIIFFNSALISSVLYRFDGGDPSLIYGFKIAFARFKYIFVWSIFFSLVSLIIKIIESRSESAQEMIASILGLTWSICSYLVIPVMMNEKTYPVAALKKSSQLIKKTWTSALKTEIGFGILAIVLFLFGILIPWLFVTPTIYSFFAMIFYYCVLWLIFSALSGIVVTGVYKYGESGEVPQGFSEELLKNAFHS